ncbi:MAG: DUF2889 domain-containing protein [Deltaproteobacteria bacterium]|nr:MAG: DUF2889 domain-containing protein [Deltaproteobacteria bacterium]
MDFQELTSLAKHRKQTFGRIVKCEMYRVDGGFLAITRMHDDFHDIALALLLDESYEVKDAAVSMERIPFPQCEEKPPETVKRLVGLRVYERGVLKKVRQLIPRVEGCTHLFEMIESTFRAVFSGSYNVIGASFEGALDLTLEEERQLWMSTPILADTCYSFSRDQVNEEVLRQAREKVERAKEVAKKIRVLREE